MLLLKIEPTLVLHTYLQFLRSRLCIACLLARFQRPPDRSYPRKKSPGHRKADTGYNKILGNKKVTSMNAIEEYHYPDHANWFSGKKRGVKEMGRNEQKKITFMKISSTDFRLIFIIWLFAFLRWKPVYKLYFYMILRLVKMQSFSECERTQNHWTRAQISAYFWPHILLKKIAVDKKNVNFFLVLNISF